VSSTRRSIGEQSLEFKNRAGEKEERRREGPHKTLKENNAAVYPQMDEKPSQLGFPQRCRLRTWCIREAGVVVWSGWRRRWFIRQMALPNASPETLLSGGRSRSSHEQRKLI
jgi:hypothetical protein